MSAKKFLEHLESQGFLDDSVIAELRQKVDNAKTRITPEAVAKLLVDKGHLTKFQATKIISAVAKASEEESLLSGRPDDDDDVVMLEDASGGGLTPQAPAAPQTPTPSAAPPGGLTPLDAAPGGGLTPLDDGGLTPLDGSPAAGMTDGGLGGGLDAGLGGGLDDLMNDPMLGGGAAGAANPLAPAKKKSLFGGLGRKKSRSAGRVNRINTGGQSFSSMKFLLVIGGLLGVIVAGGLLYYVLTGGATSEELLAEAETDYNAELYGDAVLKYNSFIEKYPNDPNVSLAKVRIGMAGIWQGANDPVAALTSAKQILPTIEEEESFHEARAELATILPETAKKFAERARAATTMKEMGDFVVRTEEAMKLVNNPTYLPTSLRKQVGPTLKMIDEIVETARRVINRDEELLTTIAGMKQATDSGDTAKAYELRTKLLKQYPDLEGAEDLTKAVQMMTERELGVVTNDPPSLSVLTDDLPPPSDAQVTFASKSGGKVAGLENQVLAVQAGGGVYALNAADGALLWRRYIGPVARSQPVRLSAAADADLLINDEARNELVRVQIRTGKLVWRVPIGSPFTGPVVKDGAAYVCTQSGAVVKVDTGTGQAANQAVASMSFQSAPSFGAGQLYQVGDHTNIYAFSPSDLKCNEVFYLGHLAGSVQSPPVMLAGHLFVAENSSAGYTLLHVLAANQSGLQLRQAQAPMRLEGRVVVPMLAADGRLVVVTDQGCIYVFGVNAANKKQPVAPAVAPLIAQKQNIAYPHIDRTSLWVADNQLARYDLRGKLSPKSVTLQGHDFLAPLQQIGEVLFGVRSPPGSAGVTVSAIDRSTGQEKWGATIAAPPGKLLVDSQGKVFQITSRAGLFAITPQSLQSGLGGPPISQASGDMGGQAYRHAIEMDNGRIALYSASDPERFLIYDPAAGDAAMQLRKIDVAADPATAPVFAVGGLVVPLVNGEVVVIDPATGKNLVRPFHPKLKAGARVSWFRPAVVGDKVVLADDRKNLYQLGVSTKGAPHLAQKLRITLEETIASPLAAAGETVYTVARAEKDTVLTFDASTLKQGKKFELTGRVVWGPVAVGDVVFVVSDRDGLLCFEQGETQKWAAKLATPYLAGPPLPFQGDYLLAIYDGTIVRIAGDTGAVVAEATVGEPIAAAPVASGEDLMTAGGDGTMHVIKLPAQ